MARRLLTHAFGFPWLIWLGGSQSLDLEPGAGLNRASFNGSNPGRVQPRPPSLVVPTPSFIEPSATSQGWEGPRPPSAPASAHRGRN